jgi:hypothetical protein
VGASHFQIFGGRGRALKPFYTLFAYFKGLFPTLG